MKYEEVLEIIERVRNGEKAEDIIDFNQPTRSGEMTPSQVFDLALNSITCRECEKLLKGNEMFFCKDCVRKSQEHFSKVTLGKEFDEKDNWTWAIGLMAVASIFGWNGDKDKKE